MGGACDVSFKTDIYDALLSEVGKAKCADAGCHGDMAAPGAKDFFLPAGSASDAHAALLAYQFDSPAGPYISCGSPDDSRFLCNMFLGAGNPNPYPKCGTTMPQLTNPNVSQEVLTLADLELIKEWIKCGAPNN